MITAEVSKQKVLHIGLEKGKLASMTCYTHSIDIAIHDINKKEIENIILMLEDYNKKMNNCSDRGCVYDYHEDDTNYGECRHPDFDPENPDNCPGYYSKEDARADAKHKDKDKY